MKREVRCESDAVPQLYMGAIRCDHYFLTKRKWEGSKSDDHKPGDLPILAHINAYEDRRC